MKVSVKKISPLAKIPVYGSEDAAGADLFAAIGDAVTILPGETAVIPTGLAFEIPKGYGGFIYARSGLGIREGLAPANKVGVIDADYRGEVRVALLNHSAEPRRVEPGQRVAQMVIAPFLRADFAETDELSGSFRGSGGFGSTGK